MEVASIQQADQFQSGKTAYACGFFSVAMVSSMAAPGQAPTKAASQIINDAEAWYEQYNGNNTPTNDNGMSTNQLYALLHQVGLAYQVLPANVDAIRAAVNQGYPVVVAADESHIHDLELGGAVPYPWNTNGMSHIFLITGLDGNNFLARDSANIIPPNTLRPGPRTYDAQKLSGGLLSATAIIPNWKANIPMIPNNWKDDGTTLTAPNNIPVVRGFRDYVLNHAWDADNYPLEPEHAQTPLETSNPALGNGTQQVFRMATLEWTPDRGVFVSWVGQELLTLRQKQQATLPADLVAKLQAADNAIQSVISANH